MKLYLSVLKKYYFKIFPSASTKTVIVNKDKEMLKNNDNFTLRQYLKIITENKSIDRLTEAISQHLNADEFYILDEAKQLNPELEYFTTLSQIIEDYNNKNPLSPVLRNRITTIKQVYVRDIVVFQRFPSLLPNKNEAYLIDRYLNEKVMNQYIRSSKANPLIRPRNIRVYDILKFCDPKLVQPSEKNAQQE